MNLILSKLAKQRLSNTTPGRINSLEPDEVTANVGAMTSKLDSVVVEYFALSKTKLLSTQSRLITLSRYFSECTVRAQRNGGLSLFDPPILQDVYNTAAR